MAGIIYPNDLNQLYGQQIAAQQYDPYRNQLAQALQNYQNYPMPVDALRKEEPLFNESLLLLED